MREGVGQPGKLLLIGTEQVWRVWTGVTTLVFRSHCNAPALFSKSTKKVL